MTALEQLDQIDLVAQAGKAITVTLSADDQFKLLHDHTIAAILWDLSNKFDQIIDIIGTNTTPETTHQ